MTSVPTHARCVVIGGGIVGCSVAYHLARAGWTDVVLLERSQLTAGSTWHAAGLVGQLRTNANVTQLLKHSVELYERLEAETGQASGWKRNGGLRLACNADRLIEIKRQATTARSFGLDMHLLSPAEAKDLWPLMAASDLVGAAFLPTDGQANPSDITQALTKGARQQGVRIIEDCAVTGFRIERGRVAGVLTDPGEIACEAVALCAGLWSKALGRVAGVRVPLQPVQHQYMITEPIEGVTPDLPTLRDPDRLIYFKEEVGGLVMGGYEPDPKPWAEDGVPEGFHFALLDPDWDHFEQLMQHALMRVPALESAGVKQLINGPESFTPDGNFILGAAPEVRGFYVGCGFNAFGIASAGGAGRALAEWIAAGEPPMTCGRSTSAASACRTATTAGCADARSSCTASTTPSPGRARSTRAAGRSAARRCTTACATPVPCSARSSAGSAPTGSPGPAATSRATSTALRGRTGSRRSPRSIAPAASASPCSTPPRSRSSCSSGGMPRRRCPGSARATLRGRRDAWSTPRC
jgi:sarcosine dehydrogenase